MQPPSLPGSFDHRAFPPRSCSPDDCDSDKPEAVQRRVRWIVEYWKPGEQFDLPVVVLKVRPCALLSSSYARLTASFRSKSTPSTCVTLAPDSSSHSSCLNCLIRIFSFLAGMIRGYRVWSPPGRGKGARAPGRYPVRGSTRCGMREVVFLLYPTLLGIKAGYRCLSAAGG